MAAVAGPTQETSGDIRVVPKELPPCLLSEEQRQKELPDGAEREDPDSKPEPKDP